MRPASGPWEALSELQSGAKLCVLFWPADAGPGQSAAFAAKPPSPLLGGAGTEKECPEQSSFGCLWPLGAG